MTAQLLDGKKLSVSIQEKLIQAVKNHVSKGGLTPCLAVILVGDDPASIRYVSHKIAACDRIGIESRSFRFPEEATEEEVAQLIDELNEDPSVHGILLQCPLPERRPVFPLLSRISPSKDVDGLHPYNQGCLFSGKPQFHPCTPWGIMQLLSHYSLDLAGKQVLMVGSSTLVGRPMALECLLENATPVLAHRFTRDLDALVSQADVLVSAIGRRGVINASLIKSDAIVIDVGMNTDENGRVCGDIDASIASERAAWITPVPGGVGPMTVITLMQNTCLAAGVPLT